MPEWIIAMFLIGALLSGKRTAGSLQPLCEGVVVLGAVRKPDARAVPGTSSDNRRRG